MDERKKLIDLLDEFPVQMEWHDNADLANYLLSNGVRLETKQATSDESKRIEELEAELAEREKVVIQLRKQWQDAEMHICTMCGHFDHKTDGNIVYGNKNCGEIVGYPYCAEKFTPWIPVTERLPENTEKVLALSKSRFGNGYLSWLVRYNPDSGAFFDYDSEWGNIKTHNVTHWMPLPEAPKDAEDG